MSIFDADFLVRSNSQLANIGRCSKVFKNLKCRLLICIPILLKKKLTRCEFIKFVLYFTGILFELTVSFIRAVSF